jgi:hypothetical protein
MPAKSLFCVLALLCVCTVSKAQLSESFNDGDLVNSPVWGGDTSQWMVNSSRQLQSNDTVKNGSFYISTTNTLSFNTQWELYVNLTFNTSSANYVDVYLMASASDLTDKNTTGYFVRLGGTKDDICLYRKDTAGVITKLIDGVDGILSKSNNVLKLKVTRDSSYQWVLNRDITGTGNSYVSEGSADDSVYNSSSFFGIFIKQSTASFFKKHFFDDIRISTIGTATTPVIDTINALDVIVNEILFNPKPGGVDYVELYNRSDKTIALNQLFVANRNSTGDINGIVPLSTGNDSLYPQHFIVATEDPNIVQSQYITTDLNAFIKVNNMPSFNDDNGDVIILNAQDTIIDELKYDAGWQFPLINDPEGVSLERIDYNASTQSPNNWHSAATSVGYGTPGYKNSQYKTDTVQGSITVSPGIFSPDNDGMDDFATIDYSFPQPGYIANITIFDISGRPVRYLEQNALCGTKGNFRWDGLGEKEQALPIGIYIVFTEVFDLEGKSAQFKNTIVLARKQ